MEIERKTCKQDEVKALPDVEVTQLLREVPQWSFRDRAIEREFKFKDFREAIEFVNKVAALSEAADHHPDIFISYNRVRLALSTHKVAALSCKDFVLAKQIDPLTGSGR